MNYVFKKLPVNKVEKVVFFREMIILLLRLKYFGTLFKLACEKFYVLNGKFDFDQFFVNNFLSRPNFENLFKNSDSLC